jgi:dihydropyrimidinase
MDSFDLVITNGICVTASDVAAFDVAIKDEKIALLAPSGSLGTANAAKVIDAQGGFITVSLSKPPW